MTAPGTDRALLGRATLSVEMVIRLCEEGDLPALEWMGLYSRDRALIHGAFEAQCRGDGLMLLGLTGGFPVGQVWIDFERGKEETVAYLWAVRSFYPLHGIGIGRHLMTAAEALLRERGIHRAELGVERSNEAALRFYERLGWRVAGELTETNRVTAADGTLVEETLDQWLMAKDLGKA